MQSISPSVTTTRRAAVMARAPLQPATAQPLLCRRRHSRDRGSVPDRGRDRGTVADSSADHSQRKRFIWCPLRAATRASTVARARYSGVRMGCHRAAGSGDCHMR